MTVVVGAILVIAILWGLANPFVGVLGLLGVYTLQPGEQYRALQILHPERLMVLTVLLSFLLHRKKKLEFSPITKRVLLLWFVMFLGAPFSPFWRTGALMVALDFGKVVIYHFLIANLVDTRRRLWIFVVVFVLVMGIVASQGLYNYFVEGRTYWRSEGLGRMIADNSNFLTPNALGVAMAFTLPFAALLIIGESFWLRLVGLAVGTACLSALILTASRASFFVFIFMFLVLGFFSRRRLVLMPLVAVLLIVVWVLTPADYQQRYLTVTNLHDESYQARVISRTIGVQMIKDHPIFGVGAGMFYVASGTEYWPGPGRRRWLGAHNLYVQVWAELGIGGVIAFGLFLFQLFRDLRILRQQARNAVNCPTWLRYFPLACFSIIMGLLLSGWSAHNLMRDMWYFIAALGVAAQGIFAREFQAAPETVARRNAVPAVHSAIHGHPKPSEIARP